MPTLIRSRLRVQASLSATLALLAAPIFAQSLSLLDARVVEGNGGSSLLLFEARLTAPASGPVSFSFATSDGSATAGSDYTAQSLGLLSIPAGQTSRMISVPVSGDAAVEANEYVNASIGNVAGATLAVGAAKGLIVNDDHTMLVSATADPGAQTGSTGWAYEYSATSRDGRFVAFVSNARDLVPGRPANVVYNVYVRDTRTGVTTLASIAADGGDSNSDSSNPALSADGRYVVFQSAASNLIANDPNGSSDVFRRDLLTGATSLVSVNRDGTGPATGYSTKASLSADGRYVAFQSTAADLVAVDSNGKPDAFLRDMQAGTTLLASVGTDGVDSAPEGAWGPKLSADGRYVAFDKGANDVWRRDVVAGISTQVSFSGSGGSPNSSSYTAGISADGRYVVFSSWASNLGTPVPSMYPQIYVRDVQAGSTEMVSYASSGNMALESAAYHPSISDDGRYVAFQSYGHATADDSDGFRDVFVRDLQADNTLRASQPWIGVGGSTGGASEFPVISGDGRVVAFLSGSTQLQPGDGNGLDDIFRVELAQDPALPALSINDVSVSEGNAGMAAVNFTISLSAPATSPVGFAISTADGTAVAGSDYEAWNWQGQSIAVGQSSASISILVNGDSVPEADEAFNLYLGNVIGARVADGHAVVAIGNDDLAPPPALSIGDVSISEGNSGSKLATFTVTLSAAAATAASFDVVTSNGSAIAGSDYVAASQAGVSIPAGSTSQAVTVVINGDGVVEADETFLVQVSNVSGATVVDGQAIGTITNDDAYPSLSIADVSITEGNSGTQQATFTLTLSAVAASPVTYDIATADGNAVAGSDYVARALTGQIIPVGASSATFTVTINGDTAVEGASENFRVNVGNVVGAIVADGQAEGIIIDDDVLPSLSIADVAIVEGNSGTRLATFTVQLSAPASAPVGYSIATADGTAVAPTDYTAASLTGQTIAAGASSASFTVSINGDLAIEPSETFQVNVSNVTGATVVDGSAVGTISTDDTLPSLSIADVSITEGNSSSKLATFTVTLSKAAAGSVTFNIATANGTAIAPGDYTARTATAQAIAAGTLTRTFTVSIKGDKTVEPSETYFVNVSSVSGATVADGQALGTIVNDDGAALSVSRVTTGGLVDDVDDRRGDPLLTTREYALLLLDSARQVCARNGGTSIVAIDGVENLAALADLADTANRLCPRQPQYSAVLKGNDQGFLVDGAASKANAHGTQVLELSTLGVSARATAMTVLAEGHERPLTVLLAATPSNTPRERVAQSDELNRLVRTRLSADPRARLVVLGAAGLDGLVDLTARELPAGVVAAERVWVSASVLLEFDSVRIELPGAPKVTPMQQVLQLLP